MTSHSTNGQPTDLPSASVPLHIIAIVAVLVVIVHPEAYRFTRIVVCASAALIAFGGATRIFWFFVALAIAFNPFVPLPLGRTVWLFVDWIVMAVIASDVITIVRSRRSMNSPSVVSSSVSPEGK